MVEPEFQSIPTQRVRVPPAPSRVTMDPERVAALADDIALNGLLQPIGVAGPDPESSYLLGFGHRRLCAHQLLARSSIKAFVWPAGTALEAMRASENHMREELTPIEEALEIYRAVETGEAHAAVARRYRRSLEWVAARLDLLSLPQDLQDAVHARELPVSVANLLRLVEHEKYRASLVREAIDRGASAPTVRVWVAHYEADRARIELNHDTVEQIVERRAAYVVKYQCEACSSEVPMQDTSALRVCRRCMRELLEAIRQAAPPAG